MEEKKFNCRIVTHQIWLDLYFECWLDSFYLFPIYSIQRINELQNTRLNENVNHYQRVYCLLIIKCTTTYDDVESDWIWCANSIFELTNRHMARKKNLRRFVSIEVELRQLRVSQKNTWRWNLQSFFLLASLASFIFLILRTIDN